MNNPNHLTDRELQVASLLVEGKSNEQIAQALVITTDTVDFHLRNIYRKLGVQSAREAIPKLLKILGSLPAEKPGESVVDRGDQLADNNGEPNVEKTAATGGAAKMTFQEVFTFVQRYPVPILVSLLLVGITVFVLLKPAPWKTVRECEYPDESSAGRVIARAHASASNVHGQFGAANEEPWAAQPGYALYKNIRIPQRMAVTMRLRYSKNTPASVPIQIYIDEQPAPITLYLANQGDWDKFTDTERIDLGELDSGAHTIKIFTAGQQYGVADLDKITLAKK